ncbi:MAG: DUF305 domain-containing protein [bacterium]|nr:DUF305 domain-containing protein [bacterium]
METKSLLIGIISFIAGALLVSIAATTFDKPAISEVATESSLVGKTGDQFDEAFISQMIDHHEGAIEMAELADTNAQHTEIKQLSKDIIDAQKKEIVQMRQWQTQWGYQDIQHGQGH